MTMTTVPSPETKQRGRPLGSTKPPPTGNKIQDEIEATIRAAKYVRNTTMRAVERLNKVAQKNNEDLGTQVQVIETLASLSGAIVKSLDMLAKNTDAIQTKPTQNTTVSTEDILAGLENEK